jgi:pSer/pThr/pTyr-binding forkhead associated (FHA) protein
MVNDLGSTNGTFIEGKRLGEPTALKHQQLVTFGHVGFVFVADQRSLAALSRTTEGAIRNTVPARDLPDDSRLRLVGPSQSGGGLAEYGGQKVQLGATQFALVRLLADRFLAEQAQPAEVRGFVRTVDLLASLPWDTAHPDDNHAKQMVRRVRRQLERLGLPDLIESRHGFGYRLTSAPLLVGG